MYQVKYPNPATQFLFLLFWNLFLIIAKCQRAHHFRPHAFPWPIMGSDKGTSVKKRRIYEMVAVISRSSTMFEMVYEIVDPTEDPV